MLQFSKTLCWNLCLLRFSGCFNKVENQESVLDDSDLVLDIKVSKYFVIEVK